MSGFPQGTNPDLLCLFEFDFLTLYSLLPNVKGFTLELHGSLLRLIQIHKIPLSAS